jgi:hypothetical protein
MRRPADFAVLAALAGAVVAGWVAPAGAASAVTVDAGYDSLYAPGRSLPVRVRVEADRLVRGAVEVRGGALAGPEARNEVRLPVEVPGGSAKEFLVVLPAQRSFEGIGGALEVTARLVDGSRREVAGSSPVSLRPTADQELVGLLPGVLAGGPVPGPAPLAVEAGVARFVAVGPAELAQAPATLEPLGTLGLADDELARLAPSARAGVLRWVAAGGQLLVDGRPGDRVEGLPEDWQPGAGGRADAGRGRLVLTGGAMASGRWAGLVEPTPRAGGVTTTVVEPVGNALANDAGLRVPELGWLLVFLLAYVVVVGPLTALVLGRLGRAELAWVVIPVVAVVFTAGSWAGAHSLRGGTRLAHGTVVELSPAGAIATTFVGVAARSEQRAGVGFDEGWTAGRNPTGFERAPAPSVVETTSKGPVARLALDAGGFGVARGEGPVEPGGALDLEAVSEVDGRARGKVRNRLSFPLEQVAVFVAGGGTLVGSLAAGEEREWVVAGANRGGGFDAEPVEAELWRDAAGRFGPPDPDHIVNFPLWGSAPESSDPSLRSPGMALAAGWTRAFVPPVSVNGARRSPVGRTVLVARAPVRPVGGTLTDLTVRREVVRAGQRGFLGRGVVFHGTSPSTVVRFTLPDGAAPRPLVARLPAAGGVEIWLDGAWQRLPTVGGADPVPGRGVRAVPVPGPPFRGVGRVADYDVAPAAVQRGQVWFRIGPDGDLPLVGNFTLREKR